MSDPFALLRPLLGKTWRGIFQDCTPEKPIVDVARWELALNGKTVRILPDGSLQTWALYYTNGAWVEGYAVHYVEYPQAEVKFKEG